MTTGGQNDSNQLFSDALKATQSGTTQQKTQAKQRIFELLIAHQVTAVTQEDIRLAIVMSNNMGNETVQNEDGVKMLERICNIPSVKDNMGDYAYGILEELINLADMIVLDKLISFPEIKECLLQNEDDFVDIAQNYNHEDVLGWIQSQKPSFEPG